MSLERYFQRAHDEARRLLDEKPWLRQRPGGREVPVWAVTMARFGDSDDQATLERAAREPVTAVRAALEDFARVKPTLLRVERVRPFGLQRILDRAMADTDGSPTLAAGEGVEARRLLEMVAWDRVPQARWPEVFETLRMAVAWRKSGCAGWLATTRAMLAEDGWLAEAAERSAA